MTRPLRSLFALCCATLLLSFAGGCTLLGYAAATVGSEPQVGARYGGLANQRVGVMTWADRAVKFYYSYMGSDIQADISAAVTDRLRIAADPKARTEELANLSLVDARPIYQWQRNHPEWDNRLATDVAPQLAASLPMTRLIHIELQEFMTRDPNTEFLLRGHAVVNIRVVEIDPATREARQAFEELGVQVNFPAKAPEGVPPTQTFTEDTVRRGLIGEIATAVAIRFFTHQQQPQQG